MDIDLIFRIAGSGNTCFCGESGFETQWTGRTGFFDKSCRTCFSFVLGRSIYQ